MELVEIRLLREGERAKRMLNLLEAGLGRPGVDVVGGRAFQVEASNWYTASAILDDALTRIAGDTWREYLAFVAPRGYERPPSRTGRV